MGKIKVTDNVGGISGLKVIEPTVFGDARGYFMETAKVCCAVSIFSCSFLRISWCV